MGDWVDNPIRRDKIVIRNFYYAFYFILNGKYYYTKFENKTT